MLYFSSIFYANSVKKTFQEKPSQETLRTTDSITCREKSTRPLLTFFYISLIVILSLLRVTLFNKENLTMSVNEMIGHRIRAQREKLGLKQHDIAHALQISPQAVSKWERGENAPDISLLVPLAKLLSISTDALLGYHAEYLDVFEATVFFSNVEGYASKAKSMPPKDVATWANGFFFQLTEAILHYDGIPIKYMGDGFICFSPVPIISNVLFRPPFMPGISPLKT